MASLTGSILKPESARAENPLRVFLIGFVIVGLIGLSVVQMVAKSTTHQRDLRTYYFAATAFKTGLNPYDQGILAQLSGDQLIHPFVYPPLVLPILLSLTAFKFSTVYYLFLSAKLLALIAISWIWRKDFVPEMGAMFFLFAALAFNAALYVDIQVGNISVFEQLLIWLGFHFLLQRKAGLFSALIIVVASFKIAPLVFLGLVLLASEPRKYRTLTISLAAFVLLQAMSYLVFPRLSVAFMGNLAGLDERGVLNPSSFALLSDGFDFLASELDWRVPAMVPTGVFGVAAAAIVGLSLPRLRMLSRGGNLTGAICLASLVFALANPRFKAYSYILVIVPTYVAVANVSLRTAMSSRIAAITRGVPVILMMVLSSLYLVAYGNRLVESNLLGYSPLVAAFLAWGLYLAGRPELPLAAPEGLGH